MSEFSNTRSQLDSTTVYHWTMAFEHGTSEIVRATNWIAAVEAALDFLHNSPDHENLIALEIIE